MAKPIRKRKCKHCHIFFPPDPRNARNQQYCSKLKFNTTSKTVVQYQQVTIIEICLGTTNIY